METTLFLTILTPRKHCLKNLFVYSAIHEKKNCSRACYTKEAACDIKTGFSENV